MLARFFRLSAFCICFLFASVPQTSWPQIIKDGKPLTGPNIASTQGFTASLWITENEDFFRQFTQGGTIRFDGITNVRRNVPVFLTLFFSGPGIDASGAANVVADIVIRKPDGTIYFEGKEAPCWTGNYPYSPDSMQVADATVKLRIEPHDPAGEYSAEAIVRDRNKKVDLSLKEAFDVAK